MGIGYNLNIPAASHSPSTDQPNMLTNNNNIATYVAVDHVPFNTSGSGQHEQVTFNANNVPSIPTSPPVLFTNIQDGAGNNLPGSIPEIFYYSGSAAQGKNNYVSAQNGSTFLFGGIIAKWGLVTGAANNTTVSFGVPFPNNCFVTLVSGGLASGTQPTININTASETVNGFVLKISGTTPVNVFYLSIGN